MISELAGDAKALSARAPKGENTIMYEHMLIAVDGQELSNKAQAQAIRLAKAIRAKVTPPAGTSRSCSRPRRTRPLSRKPRSSS
jgi:hypothetical protein